MEDAYLLPGVLGGYVTSGPGQGNAAAQMLVRYLRGNADRPRYRPSSPVQMPTSLTTKSSTGRGWSFRMTLRAPPKF